MRLGFIGTGTITKAIVTGLCTVDSAPHEIWVSPRNSTIALALARKFSCVRIAASNQEALDHVDTVLLAVRPQIARGVLGSLQFRSDHLVISVIATLSQETLGPLIAPATCVVRAVPMPGVSTHLGPTAIYPAEPRTAELFGQISTVVAVASEGEFDALCACTAEMASYFALLQTCATWLTRQGVASDVGRRFLASMFKALGYAAETSGDTSFEQLVAVYMTKGGLNEQVYTELTAAGVFTAHVHSLDRILARIQSKP
jgi:pyrroline-5-carboxylate reductase